MAEELVSGGPWRALRSLTGSVSLGGSDLEGHLCPQSTDQPPG